MRSWHRGAIVIAAAAIVGAVIRLRGHEGVPPMTGRWRPLHGPEFR